MNDEIETYEMKLVNIAKILQILMIPVYVTLPIVFSLYVFKIKVPYDIIIMLWLLITGFYGGMQFIMEYLFGDT